MEHKRRSEKILHLVILHTRELNLKYLVQGLQALQIQSLAIESGISANNVSTELKLHYNSGRLIRVGNRPVAYLSLPHMEELLGRTISCRQFPTPESFIQYCIPKKAGADLPGQVALSAVTASNFDDLIGGKDSLCSQIRQAKAAILYPPYGLHTLITGPTGTGKSLFARCMFDYAIKSGRISPDKSLVTLNCANYSDNPQLLLSLLFGYVKGAFTGADRERKGLIDHADESILFLDEIHRLTPEGQEKMFLLMDQGIYTRLGETGTERHANVLILGATTEDPVEAMLNTFLRRLTVHITLPPLQERTIRERLELVLYFLWKESQNIGMRISLAASVISAFCYYECSANIGQLSSDIKLTCANAYFDYLSASSPVLSLKLTHMTERISRGLYIAPNEKNAMLSSLLRHSSLVIDGNQRLSDLLNQAISPPEMGFGSLIN